MDYNLIILNINYAIVDCLRFLFKNNKEIKDNSAPNINKNPGDNKLWLVLLII